MGNEDKDSTDRWKYVVLMSSFSMHILVGAVNKSFGVLIPDMAILFDTGSAVLGFLCSLPIAGMLMTSPIVAHVLQSDLVRPRSLAILGALFSSLSLILSGYTRSLVLLGICLFTLGIGLSMAYMTQLVALNDFYPKSFIVKNSLTEIGSTIGVVFIPLVIERCNEAYGYSGAMMILGGILLHLLATGATIHEPRPEHQGNRINGIINSEGHTEDTEGCSSSESQPGPSDSKTYISKAIATSTSLRQRGETDSFKDDDQEINTSSDACPLLHEEVTQVTERNSDQELCQVTENGSKGSQRTHHPIINWFFGCIFIREPLFTLILPANMLSQYSLYSWRLFLVPHAEWRGLVSSDAVLMSTVGGFGALTGRILLVIALQFGTDPFLLYTISSAVTAVTFLVDPWIISFRGMLGTAFLQGWTLFVNSAMWAAICKLATSPANFKLACGYASLMNGIGGNAGGFISGAIFDATQSYTKVFLCVGFVHIIIVIDLLVYMAIVRIKRRRQP